MTSNAPTETYQDVQTGLEMPETPPKTQAPVDHLVEYVLFLWNSRRFLLAMWILGIVVGAAVAFLLPVRYRSVARFIPSTATSDLRSSLLAAATSKSDLASSAMGDLFAVKTPGSYFIGLARSQTVEDEIIQRFDLRKVYRRKYLSTTREELESRTQFDEDKRSGIISLSVVDSDRYRAAKIAAAYVEELSGRSSEINVSAAHRERLFLENRVDEVSKDLNAAESALSEFSSKSATLNIDEQSKAMLNSASMLQAQLVASESELKGLERIYGADNPRVLAKKAETEEIQNQLGLLGGANGKGPVVDGEELPSIRTLPLLGTSYAQYYRNAKVLENVYLLLTQQLELAKIEEERETPSVSVVDAAEIPEKRSFPPRILVIAALSILFVVGGATWKVAQRVWGTLDEHHGLKRLFAGLRANNG